MTEKWYLNSRVCGMLRTETDRDRKPDRDRQTDRQTDRQRRTETWHLKSRVCGMLRTGDRDRKS